MLSADWSDGVRWGPIGSDWVPMGSDVVRWGPMGSDWVISHTVFRLQFTRRMYQCIFFIHF